MNFVNWTPEVFNEFCTKAILKQRELDVMKLHVYTEWTCEHIGDEVGCSAETVKRDIRKCKEKYKTAARTSDILRNAIYNEKIREYVS